MGWILHCEASPVSDGYQGRPGTVFQVNVVMDQDKKAMVKVIAGTSDLQKDMKERKRLHCEQELFGSVLFFKYRRQSEKDCEAEKGSSRENQEEEIRTES